MNREACQISCACNKFIRVASLDETAKIVQIRTSGPDKLLSGRLTVAGPNSKSCRRVIWLSRAMRINCNLRLNRNIWVSGEIKMDVYRWLQILENYINFPVLPLAWLQIPREYGRGLCDTVFRHGRARTYEITGLRGRWEHKPCYTVVHMVIGIWSDLTFSTSKLAASILSDVSNNIITIGMIRIWFDACAGRCTRI